MKDLLNNKHVLVGVFTALLTGLAWVALLKGAAHMSFTSIAPWIVPIVLILVLLGASVGALGKRRAQKPWKIAFSTWVGTGFAAFAMMPLTAIIALPLGKLGEWLGLVDRAAMSSDLASALVIISMLFLWLVVGIAIGSGLLFVVVNRPPQADMQKRASEVGA